MTDRPAFVDRLVVLDDDPTGVQTLAGIRVLLAWDDPARIGRALAGRRSVHLVTNARALEPDEARRTVTEAARAALSGVDGARLALRGDSTLRAHLLEEYLGLCAALDRGRPPVLLVPALPSAGRVTREGVHLLERAGRAQPLHETEYAVDGVFAYSTARLLDWAEERSGGLFPASAGRELHLDELRAGGDAAVADALTGLARAGRPAVLVPDAETEEDLATIAAGYGRALRDGVEAVVRCAPALAGILAGTTAPGLGEIPITAGRLLVVCGSYVPMSTRQLTSLVDEHPGVLVEVDVRALAGPAAAREQQRAAGAASAAIERTGMAVLATGRERPEGTTGLAAGRRIAEGLARAAGLVEPGPDLVIAKGGITSAVTLADGFGFSEADVLGPVVPGVSHWRASRDGTALDYLVVPGNVGDERLLADLVRRVLER
ncbi:MAG TPA: four-carbon acid sugar kinase family protein [Gaiellaceae bacterium]|jgi:uncharacterized protein YgbK (DUF1537 family)